jgi:hypothetical protein
MARPLMVLFLDTGVVKIKFLTRGAVVSGLYRRRHCPFTKQGVRNKNRRNRESIRIRVRSFGLMSIFIVSADGCFYCTIKYRQGILI